MLSSCWLIISLGLIHTTPTTLSIQLLKNEISFPHRMKRRQQEKKKRDLVRVKRSWPWKWITNFCLWYLNKFARFATMWCYDSKKRQRPTQNPSLERDFFEFQHHNINIKIINIMRQSQILTYCVIRMTRLISFCFSNKKYD